MKELEDVYGVPGMLTRDEVDYLYRLAKRNPGNGVIVEIGSRKGLSTIALARGTAGVDGEKVFAIDPHEPIPEEGYDDNSEKEFLANLKRAGVDQFVVPMIMTSEQAAIDWSHPVRMLWIDGDHRYDAVHLDFALWEPHLVEGGILAMHDTIRKRGPKRVLWENIFRSNRFAQIAIVDNITAVRKVKSKPLLAKLRDGGVLALRGLYIAARKSRVPYSKPFGRWLFRTMTAKD
ncbi:MAG TPA: class I SAM-dependent methyltransferase [Candidatus Binatia bacterium]|jgi:predicted O-methyltransferase YrrM